MFQVIVPTLNAARDWPRFAGPLLACVRPEQVLVIDSSSDDGTADLARAAGFRVCSIAREAFNHGGTRQMAADLLPDAEILVYMTQDALLQDRETLQRLVAAFEDPAVGAAYGRQLPRLGAGAIEAHSRLFNYPAYSGVKTLASRSQFGIKTAFLSNSLAAYRRSVLMEVRGFPRHTIFGEDTITAAFMLLAGHKIAYVAEAQAYHSHPYTPTQEFKRYFDIGVLHSREGWLLEEFGKATGEGKRFVLSELRYLCQHEVVRIPSAILRTVCKLLGYRLGRKEALLPLAVKRRLSMHPGFWKDNLS